MPVPFRFCQLNGVIKYNKETTNKICGCNRRKYNQPEQQIITLIAIVATILQWINNNNNNFIWLQDNITNMFTHNKQGSSRWVKITIILSSSKGRSRKCNKKKKKERQK